MKTINNKQLTDQAWKQVYNRLQQDGLVEASSPKRVRLYPSLIKWAASIAVLAVLIISITLYTTNNKINYIETVNDVESMLVTPLQDGSLVYLSNFSALKYPEEFSHSKREVIFDGSAYFNIAKNETSPFIIETNKAIIEVIGTAFSIENKNNSFTLSVHHGKVKVTSKDSSDSMFVEPGETVSLESDLFTKKQTESIDVFSKYFEKIRFKDQPLKDIIRTINSNSDSVKIDLVPKLNDLNLTVTFANNNAETIAKIICQAYNLQFKRDLNTIYITE